MRHRLMVVFQLGQRTPPKKSLTVVASQSHLVQHSFVKVFPKVGLLSGLMKVGNVRSLNGSTTSYHHHLSLVSVASA